MATTTEQVDFTDLVARSLAGGECLSLVLSKHRSQSADAPERAALRPVTIRGALEYQLATRRGKQEFHENLKPAEAVRRVTELLRTTFRDCHLFTPLGDYSLRIAGDGSAKVSKSPPTKRPAPTEHDRSKNYLIPENVPCPFLEEIGVMTAAGAVRASKQRKFRQINRFLEIVGDVVEHLPPSGVLQVVDFGCGKSYLTFALYHLLAAIHARQVRILGVDQNRSVVDDCNRIARNLGCDGLTFHAERIADTAPPTKVDLCVSLHACDTATDDALAKAVQWQADVILAVPCCQHELLPKIHGDETALIEQHGILKERFAALATDALRAQLLELCSYRTQVLEFIDMEHTAKNLLIRGIRRTQDDTNAEQKRQSYKQFKQLLNLDEIYLERLLTERQLQRLKEGD